MGLEIEMSLEGMRERLQGRIDAAQNVMTQECKKAADFFTPMREGDLKGNFEYTKNERGAFDGWIYKEPYSRRQWYGMTEERVAKRTVTKKGEIKGATIAARGFNYSLIKNDKARSRWTEHAAQNHKDDITRKVREEFEK